MDVSIINTVFNIEGQITTATPFGNGHINDTFRLFNQAPSKPDYLLQRINHLIFKEVEQMMLNIQRVTEHVNQRLPGSTLELIGTRTGENYYRDTEGNYWRVYRFRKALHSLDVAQTPAQIYEGAKAFGRFLFHLADFPAHTLHPTIPHFHDVIIRLQQLQDAVRKDSEGRVKAAQAEIDYSFQITEIMERIQKAGERGEIPLRVTHNDTKFNNVLLDEAGRGRCVIDLETVMPGYVHYDFGDGIRTTVTTAEEDEADLSKIIIDLERFQAFAQGFLEETRDILSPAELQYLPLAGPLLSYLMGIRFLADFLRGDSYYKVHFEGQNLQRARAQLQLTKNLLAQQDALQDILKQA
ncbi:MAG: aminoglycoside phosphotransferase family protein [Saprospiraceae bacterium]|nr:aminoglycoside phosphotransferase family protein [Saprospiraceae bacterium]